MTQNEAFSIDRIQAATGLKAVDILTLVKFQKALYRWHLAENGHYSCDRYLRFVTVDEETGEAFTVVEEYRGPFKSREKIQNRESVTIKKLAKFCEERGIYWHWPGGWQIFVSRQPISKRDPHATGVEVYL